MYDELRSIGSQLEDVLEYLQLASGYKVRGDNFHIQVEDGYLDFIVDYSYFVRKIKDADETMEIATSKVALINK